MKNTRKNRIAKLRRAGWAVRRGGYVGTCDDRIEGWYIDSPQCDYADRRGPGYPTRAAAWDEILNSVVEE